ncbi:MAG: hypothetical protein Q9210_004632 [Variospora velana]
MPRQRWAKAKGFPRQITDRVLTGEGAGRLALTMMSYKPEVRCKGLVILDDLVVTDEILRKMPAPSTRTTFGRPGVPGVRVALPRVYISVDRVLKTKLVATVDVTSANVERASWYDIWAATVAISGMCVRNGKGGSSTYLGRKHSNGKRKRWLMIEIGDAGKMVVTITEEPAENKELAMPTSTTVKQRQPQEVKLRWKNGE